MTWRALRSGLSGTQAGVRMGRLEDSLLPSWDPLLWWAVSAWKRLLIQSVPCCHFTEVGLGAQNE